MIYKHFAFDRKSPYIDRKTLLASVVEKGPSKTFVSFAFLMFTLIVQRWICQLKITVILRSNRLFKKAAGNT